MLEQVRAGDSPDLTIFHKHSGTRSVTPGSNKDQERDQVQVLGGEAVDEYLRTLRRLQRVRHRR